MLHTYYIILRAAVNQLADPFRWTIKRKIDKIIILTFINVAFFRPEWEKGKRDFFFPPENRRKTRARATVDGVKNVKKEELLAPKERENWGEKNEKETKNDPEARGRKHESRHEKLLYALTNIPLFSPYVKIGEKLMRAFNISTYILLLYNNTAGRILHAVFSMVTRRDIERKRRVAIFR